MAQHFPQESASHDRADIWMSNPRLAFDAWQRNLPHSTGMHYAEHSLRQHRAMWNRFVDYLERHALSLATIEADRLAAFLDR